MAKIFIIDDESTMSILSENLIYRGHHVSHIKSIDEALKKMHVLKHADLVILDIIMPWSEQSFNRKDKNGTTAGMQVLIELKKVKIDIPVLIYSATQDLSIKSSIEGYRNVFFISKWENKSLNELIKKITKILLKLNSPISIISFIVHGHDELEKYKLKNFIQNTLHFPEPIILHEQVNRGHTLIQKLEQHSMYVDIVFVLLTPDDKHASDSDNEEIKYRARQNVIFELGYFLGLLGRESGRVLLLYKGKLEIPSDIQGIVYIDITNGLESAGEIIRREIENID